jgi:large subunit ribosomal protein L29
MKQSEISTLSVAELQEKLVQFKKTYTELTASHTIKPLVNPSQLRAERRTIARLATEISKREVQ